MSLLTSHFLKSGIYLMHNRKKEARRKATNESEKLSKDKSKSIFKEGSA